MSSIPRGKFHKIVPLVLKKPHNKFKNVKPKEDKYIKTLIIILELNLVTL